MKKIAVKPRWYRPSIGNVFSWEIYDWRCFYLSFSFGTLEIQINKWPPNQSDEEN